MWLHQPIAALAARTVGRPVKLVMRRQEMFNGHGHRTHIVQKMELGAQADGTLTLIRHESLNETSMRDEWREETGHITGMLYACANVETSQQAVLWLSLWLHGRQFAAGFPGKRPFAQLGQQRGHARAQRGE